MKWTERRLTKCKQCNGYGEHYYTYVHPILQLLYGLAIFLFLYIMLRYIGPAMIPIMDKIIRFVAEGITFLRS